MTTSTKPLHEERIEEPAKAWRNWWKVIDDRPILMRQSGRLCLPGQIYPSIHAWPSKDVAEQKASEGILGVSHSGRLRCLMYEHLGAFPEGQRP